MIQSDRVGSLLREAEPRYREPAVNVWEQTLGRTQIPSLPSHSPGSEKSSFAATPAP